jgi:two-component system chemotaxis response regulator CheY
MNIGSKIRELRTQKNLTQEELAQKLNVTPQAVSRWECGLSLPDTSIIPLISKTLFVSADELLGCDTQNIPKSTPNNNGQYISKNIPFESCASLDCSGTPLNQSQIDSIFENIDILSHNVPKKVLIVDDSDFMRMILNDILTNAGHTVVQADNGRLALKVLQKEKVDICILDILMPEMNGIDTLKQILSNTPDMPVIMLSALCSEHIVKEALEIGAKAFVAKPFQPDSITNRI